MREEGGRRSGGPGADFDGGGEDVVVAEEGVLEVVFPVGVEVVLAGDEVDQEFVAGWQLLHVDQLAASEPPYPSYFSR